MNTEFVLFLCAGAFASGFVNGFAGVGTSLFSLGWLLQVLSPVEAVATSICLAIISGVQGLVLVWSSIRWQALMRFVLPALIGVPIGIYLLGYLNASVLTLMVAFFLIAYGGFFAFNSRLPNLRGEQPLLDGGVGFIGGILGAVGGLSGALPAVLCSMRPWPKMQQRALLQPFNAIILLVSAVMLLFRDAYNATTLKSILIASPVTLSASLIGIYCFRRVTDTQFRRLLIVLMLVSGIILLLSEVL